MSRRKHDLLPSAARLIDHALLDSGRPLPGYEGPLAPAVLPGRAAAAPITDAADSAERAADAAEHGPLGNGDFSRVRVHTDDAAAESARALGARAFTFGSHIVFAKGELNPNQPAGRDLLAHELAHVRQNLHVSP